MDHILSNLMWSLLGLLAGVQIGWDIRTFDRLSGKRSHHDNT